MLVNLDLDKTILVYPSFFLAAQI